MDPPWTLNVEPGDTEGEALENYTGGHSNYTKSVRMVAEPVGWAVASPDRLSPVILSVIVSAT